jgi:poly(3-hydroxybutyrate) depolymerase
MFYDAYQSYADIAHAVRGFASGGSLFLNMFGEWPAYPGLSGPFSGASPYSPARAFSAWQELLAFAGFTHTRPDYDIGEIERPNGDRVAVEDSILVSTPFCILRRFRRMDAGEEPRVLLVAPMSGHFSTLLRGTIRTLLQDNDVYVTEWRNPRDIPIDEGLFSFDDFVAHIIDFTRAIEAPAHIVAVCQPTVPALIATAVMAAENDPRQPASLTLMAGPIDARISPTKVNDFATSRPIDWFEKNMIGVVPQTLPGARRRVYPGFLQLAAFMSMNIDRHTKAFGDFLSSRIHDEPGKADQIRSFYLEYFAVMDLDAVFYLETIQRVFQEFALATGAARFRDAPVNLRAIRKTFLLTIEGERDDICAVGQTLAAQDLCTGLRPFMKSHYMQAGVGHYGVFNGSRWDRQVYPIVRNHIQSSM